MTKIISIEAAKRGTSQVKVETTSGDVFIIGFSSLNPIPDSERYSSMITRIMDDYDMETDGDMFSYISMQMARAKMETPLFIMPDRNDERTRIGMKIRSLREENKMEAKTLARLTDIDPANLSRIESGKFSAGLDTLCKIAMALDSKVDIVPNRKKKGQGFSMERNIWVLPTVDFNPLDPVPPYGCFYWPESEGKKVRIGDIVATYHKSSYVVCFIVSDIHVRREEFIPEIPGCGAPCPETDAISFMKLKYHTGLSSTEEAIIFDNAMRQIPGEVKSLTQLTGDIL